MKKFKLTYKFKDGIISFSLVPLIGIGVLISKTSHNPEKIKLKTYDYFFLFIRICYVKINYIEK